MMRLAIPLLVLAPPAMAQEALVITFDRPEYHGREPDLVQRDFREDIEGDVPGQKPPIAISGSSHALRSANAPVFLIQPVEHENFSASALANYSTLHEGDLAGLVVRGDPQHWLSVQIERIEPADLVAVRWRNGISSPPAGRLVATTALPGSFKERVRLKIARQAGTYTVWFASETGDWQMLSEHIEGPSGTTDQAGDTAIPFVGLFVTDGADG